MNLRKLSGTRRLAILGVVVTLATLGSTGCGDDSPEGTAEENQVPDGQDHTVQDYIAMVVNDDIGTHAMLEWTLVLPGGQIQGEYTLGGFSDNGTPGDPPDAYVRREVEFTGEGSGGSFQFDGLLQNGGPVLGTLDGDTLTVDHSFPIESHEWQIIDSVDVFEQWIAQWAADHPLTGPECGEFSENCD